MEKNYILCYKNQGIHWYPFHPTFLWKINFTLVRRLISDLIWDISGHWNRSDGRDFREKRIVFPRFLTPYNVFSYLFFFHKLQIHIQKIIETPAVAARWLQKKGKKPTDDDAERIYSKSLTATLDVLPNNSHLIRGNYYHYCWLNITKMNALLSFLMEIFDCVLKTSKFSPSAKFTLF